MKHIKNKAAVYLGKRGGAKLLKIKGKKYYSDIGKLGGRPKKVKPTACA